MARRWFPEAVDEALAVTLDSLHWNTSARTRLGISFIDAPPHEQDKERMKDWSRALPRWAYVWSRSVAVVSINQSEFLLRAIALATNEVHMLFLPDHSGVGNAHIEAATDKYDVEVAECIDATIDPAIYLCRRL